MSSPIQSEIQTRFEKLAYQRSQAFCSSCYHIVTQSHCPTCGTDDFQRLLAGEGCDWGVAHVIESLLRDNLTPINVEEAFEESIRECYAKTTKLAWIEVDTVSAIKELDPISFKLAASEWADNELSDGILTTFDNGCTYYVTSDLESFLDEQEAA